MKRFSIILMLITTVSLGLSCFIPPAESLYDYNELISNTNTIILVKCTESKLSKKRMLHPNYPQHQIFTLDTIKCLTGSYNSAAIKTGTRGIKNYKETTFSNHTDSTFWRYLNGRSEKGRGECGTSHCFKEGHTYLYFVETHLNGRAAERIDIETDAWLLYVKNQLKYEGRLNP